MIGKQFKLILKDLQIDDYFWNEVATLIEKFSFDYKTIPYLSSDQWYTLTLTILKSLSTKLNDNFNQKLNSSLDSLLSRKNFSKENFYILVEYITKGS